MIRKARGCRPIVSAGRALALVALGSGGAAWAQTPPPTPPATPPQLPSQSDISRARVGLPPPEPSKLDLSIQTPERSAVPKSVDTVEFNLRQIVVEGATAFPAAEVDAMFAGLTGRPIHLDDVRQAAARLEERYRAHGYFLTRVFVPPQRVGDGTLTVRVVEGYIDTVHVEGLDAATRSQVEAILRPLSGRKPADLPSVERRLLILNDLPGIAATSVLRQGTTLGASDLFVTLVKPASVLFASVSNSNSRILGPWVYALSGNLNRPAGLPGALTLSASASGPRLGSTQSGSARYSVGLGSGLIASLGAIAAKAHPGASLRPLDVRNDVLSISGRMRYPLVRSRAQSLFLEGGLSVNRSTTDILGQRLVKDRDTVVDVALSYQQTGWLDGSTTVSADLYHGLPILGANGRDAAMPSVANFDPNFTRLTFSLQRLQTIAPRVSASITVQGQYSRDTLLTGEQVAFGGPAIGRGYDPSTITGDRGIGGLAELRYDLPVNRPWLAGAQFYGFVDGAQTTTLATPIGGAVSSSFGSAGLGVRLAQRHVSVDLLGAAAFRRFDGADVRGDPRVLLTVTAIH